MSEERLNEIKLKYYQDGKGNIYELKTELEQIMINDIIELIGKNNKLQNIITQLEKWLKERTYGMNEIHTYKIGALEDEVILNKLKELKENNNE